MGRVRLTQIDGKLPNLALMKLAHWHRQRGDELVFSRCVDRELGEGDYDRVYGSAIFSDSAGLVERFRRTWPGAIVSGTGVDPLTGGITVEQVIRSNSWSYEHYDYSIYPDFAFSLGFSQRGCRMDCGFCSVPGKEGKPVSVNAISEIWRGHGHPRQVVLLDNDFFGQAPAAWQARIEELKAGRFEVCFNQGLNLRAMKEREAEALASLRGTFEVRGRPRKDGTAPVRQVEDWLFRDASFSRPQIYTAWDNLGDESKFMRGVDWLEAAGIPPSVLLVYMLIGYDPLETWQAVMYRLKQMTDRGMHPYPMIYGDKDRTLPLGGHPDVGGRTLRHFQRWVIRHAHEHTPFEHYDANAKGRKDKRQLGLDLAHDDECGSTISRDLPTPARGYPSPFKLEHVGPVIASP